MKADHRYNAIRNLESIDDSSTEGDEWDTHGDVLPHPRRRHHICATLRSYRWVVDTALLLIILGLLVERRQRPREQTKTERFEFAGDVTGFAPTFSQQITSFKPNHTFIPDNQTAFWDRETQDAWLGMVPRGLGYVLVEHPEDHDNLPHPLRDYPNTTVFTTSMTHQLHCLYKIIEAYNTFSLVSSSGLLAPTGPTPSSVLEDGWHINHCFEYIRQAIMCAGDVALEGAETSFPVLDPNDPTNGSGSDGWDARHVCKDYREVYEYLDGRRANDEKWI